MSVITATFTGPRRKSLFPKAARPAATCATYCHHAVRDDSVERSVQWRNRGSKAVQKHHYKIHDYDYPDKDVVPNYAEFVVVDIEVIPLLFTEQRKCHVDGGEWKAKQDDAG